MSKLIKLWEPNKTHHELDIVKFFNNSYLGVNPNRLPYKNNSLIDRIIPQVKEFYYNSKVSIDNSEFINELLEEIGSTDILDNNISSQWKLIRAIKQ